MTYFVLPIDGSFDGEELQKRMIEAQVQAGGGRLVMAVGQVEDKVFLKVVATEYRMDADDARGLGKLLIASADMLDEIVKVRAQ